MNELKVSLENIIPLTEARDHFSQIVTEVQKDKLYVLTKGGKPAVAIIDVKYLEYLTGGVVNKQHLANEIKKAPEKVGLPPMIEHNVTPQAQANQPFNNPSVSANKPPVANPVSSSQPISSIPSTPVPSVPPVPSAAPAPTPVSVQPPVRQPITPPAQKPAFTPSGPPVSSSQTPSPISSSTAPTNAFSGSGSRVDVQFSPATDAKTEEKSKAPLSSDDKVSKAQYDGEHDEAEDMAID